MRPRMVLARGLLVLFLAGCGSTAGPSVGVRRTPIPTRHPATAAPASAAAPDVPSAPATPSVGDAVPAIYDVTIQGRTVRLPIETTFTARRMPSADIGREVGRFKRQGSAAIEVLTTPWRGETHHQPEVALESGDFTLSKPKAGIIQLVTNFGMWTYVPNGPLEASRFPTHIGELVRDRDGYDLVYYMDAHLLLNAMSLESIPNLFVSHSSGSHSLRIIRVGTIKLRFENGGRSVSGEIDLIGWAVTVDFIADPLERAFYRYVATFSGRLQT